VGTFAPAVTSYQSCALALEGRVAEGLALLDSTSAIPGVAESRSRD
jgi:hypothetical protein